MREAEEDYYEQLKKLALQEGASLFGVAKILDLPEQHCSLSPKTREGLDRAISIAFHLSDRVLEDIVDGPTKLYFFHYQRVNLLLDELGLKIMNFIQSRGWSALPILDRNGFYLQNSEPRDCHLYRIA
jgi:hypothetical protein